MNTRETMTALSKKTKAEIIEMLTELSESDCLDLAIFERYIKPQELTHEESVISKKLNVGLALNQNEKDYLAQRTEKISGRKIKNILSGMNKFDAYIVEYKLKVYFKKIYTEYPKKVGRDLAYKAFEKLLGDKKLGELDSLSGYIYTKVVQYANDCIQSETDKKYIMHPSTFFNSKKYL